MISVDLNKNFRCIKKISLGLLAWVVCLYTNAQCPTHEDFLRKAFEIDSISRSTNDFQPVLTTAINLKNNYEKCGLQKDSVYAKILHRIGALQYSLEMYNEAAKNTLEAAKINTSKTKGASSANAVNNYYNLVLIYNAVNRYEKVLEYNDSLNIIGAKLFSAQQYISRTRLLSSNIYYNKGDFQKGIIEATLGLAAAKMANQPGISVELLIQRAKSYEMQKNYEASLLDVNTAINFFTNENLDDYDILADAYSCKADILADEKNYTEAVKFFEKAISNRKKTGSEDISVDYNTAGYALLYKLNKPNEAGKYFNASYQSALKNNNNFFCGLAYNNIAQISFEKKDYTNALQQYQKALQFFIPHHQLNNVFINPPHKELISLDSKNDIEIVLDNKSKCLLYLYKLTNDKKYLTASLQTALLTDSVINDLRQEQTEELSKLYWRNDTKDFYSRSLEACMLDNNASLAFYFMEKSRAILLADKISELGALQHLPAIAEEQLDGLRTEVTIQQQKLNSLDNSLPDYQSQLNKFYITKNNLDNYIKSLEQKYPLYYQYKYADKVPTLQELQSYLAKNNQSFVHYFLGDTATYILAITSSKTNFIKLIQKEFNKDDLAVFLKLCSNKEALNNNYHAFATLSNSIYKKIFQPLQLSKGRVVICTENTVIPFEALCKDSAGKAFLLKDYSFDYVYSAGFLMKQFKGASAQGNFVGFAPVSFQKYLDVQDLKNAATALNTSAKYYAGDKLFTHQSASRKNFFNYASNYAVVNIFSHAKADTGNSEPVLYMQDSLIHSSELQLLNNPATQLVLLSACQTNVGRIATGEGIYSLARGFATAGIPSVSATLWKADEQAIYAITEKFNQYLSEGMNKDEALQKAKLDYINNNSSDKMLPYYWANMILIGNTDALKLSVAHSNNILWIVGGIIFITALIFIIKKSTSA